MRSASLRGTLPSMNVIAKYRGRIVMQKEIDQINALIAANPTASRRRLSELLCEAWNWRQPNGALKDMVCRSLMLLLHRSGHIELPPPRIAAINNAIKHKKKPAQHFTLDQTPIRSKLSALTPLSFRQVRRTPAEKLYNSLIEKHHYLGYTRPVGEHLKYVIYAGDRPVACMAWSSAPRHIGARDRFIGWDQKTRKKHIHLMAYNTRFLILPWVTVKYMASHILGQMAKIVPRDWEQVYHHPLYYLETFVDPGRFKGTCYRAANWRYLGLTTGRGKDDQTMKQNRSLKEVLGYPVSKDFREKLCTTYE